MFTKEELHLIRYKIDHADYNVHVYTEFFYELLLCDTEEAAICRLQKYHVSEHTYNVRLDIFKKNFPELGTAIDFLDKLYLKYKKYFNLDKGAKSKDLEAYLQVIKNVIEYGHSAYEYCSAYGQYRVSYVNECLSKIKSAYPNVAEDFDRICNVEPSEKFYDYMKMIIVEIKTNPNFDTFDYYCYTKLDPTDFSVICRKLISPEELASINPVLYKLKKNSVTTINKEVEINGTSVIQGRTIEKEEKEKIIEYLERNNIPYAAYRAAIRKLVAGDSRIVDYIYPKQKHM